MKHTNVMPWFTPGEWAKFRTLCDDPDTMGSSYDVWLNAAKKTAQHQESDTVAVHKVYLIADRFSARASRNRRSLKSEDRVDYAMLLYIGRAV